MEEKIIEQHKINALLPHFLKHLFYNSLIFLTLYLIYFVSKLIVDLDYDFKIILYGSILTVLFSILKLSKNIFFIWTHTYVLTRTSIEDRYKFFSEDVHSISYSQITDIQIKKSLWDRICKVGDIYFHTGNDNYGDTQNKEHLYLKDVKYPEKVKEEINKRVHS